MVERIRYCSFVKKFSIARGREKNKFEWLSMFCEDEECSVRPICVPRGRLFKVSRSVYPNVLFHPIFCENILTEDEYKTKACAQRPIIHGFKATQLWAENICVDRF